MSSPPRSPSPEGTPIRNTDSAETRGRRSANPAAAPASRSSPERAGSARTSSQRAGDAASDGDLHCQSSASTAEVPPPPETPDHHDAVAGLLAISGRRATSAHDRAASAGSDRASAAASNPRRSPHFRSSYVRSDQRRVPVANANVVPPALDASTLRSSLVAIEVALEREGAFQQLRQDYADLQRQLRSAESHIQDLEHQFSEAARLASPFVQYCQHRYDLIRQDLNDSRRQFGEVVDALAGHEGDRVRIANLESQLQDARQQHAVVIDGLNQTISTLTDQLAAALLQTPTASYQDLQRMRAELNSSIAIRADLQQALNQAIAARDQLQTQLVAEIDAHTQTRQELADSQDSNSALSSSQDALEAAADQLRRQLASVQQNLAHVRLSADANFNLAIAERNQACDERDRAILDLQDRDTQLRRAHSDRDRARGEMRAYQTHVDAARQSVARLEKQIADLQSSAVDLQQLRADNTSLRTDIEVERQQRVAAEEERDRLLVERDTIGQQLAGLSSLVQGRLPTSAGFSSQVPSPPTPATPQARPSSQKRTRSRSPDSLPPSKRTRSSSGSSALPIQIDSAGDSEEGGDDQEESGGDNGPDSNLEDDDHDDQDDDRQDHQSGSVQPGGGHDSSSPSSSSSNGSNASRSSESSGFLSDGALGRLPATTISRDQWIPGYQRPQYFARRDIAPWPVAETRLISVRSLTVDVIFRDWGCPRLWLFPARQRVPRSTEWNDELITEANVRALYDAEPWTALQTAVIPHSFDLTGWFAHFALQYTTFETDHLQAMWESTHHFTLSADVRQSSAYLDRLNRERKQRRSRAGPRWKKILEIVLEGMVRGHCDLDLLLDPFLLHFPRKNVEQSTWYPGFGARVAPADLLEALALTDASDPWRNQFRDNLPDHPGLQIARLGGKFKLATSSSDDDSDQD